MADNFEVSELKIKNKTNNISDKYTLTDTQYHSQMMHHLSADRNLQN